MNRYYYRQIPRSTTISTGINLRMPNAPMQPVITDETEVYAPRYLTYKEINPRVNIFGKQFPFPCMERLYLEHLIS